MQIHIFELISDSSGHVPSNSGSTRAIAAAFPSARIRVYGAAGHLALWRDDPGLEHIEFRDIDIATDLGWRTHIVSFRRMWLEFRVLQRAVSDAPKGEPCLLVLLCASCTALHAAALLARISRRPIFVQVMLHGHLNDALSWRTRHPVRRRFDFVAAFEAENPALRFVLLEDAIRAEVARTMPNFARRCEVIPHAVDPDEAGAWTAAPLSSPLRVGLVGMATEAKGLTLFLALARRFKARYGDRIEFLIVGGRPGGLDDAMFQDIAHPVEVGHIPRHVFCQRMAMLHYVLLPISASYYRLSPSGGLMDAVAWAKPVIASALPITRDLFRQGGDIGHLCDGAEAFEACLDAILANPDPARYAQQASALRDLAARRTPQALSDSYRRQTVEAFPGLTV